MKEKLKEQSIVCPVSLSENAIMHILLGHGVPENGIVFSGECITLLASDAGIRQIVDDLRNCEKNPQLIYAE